MQELLHKNRTPIKISDIKERDIITLIEIFLTVQGEGLKTGVPTIFIRTAECNLRCSFCDTKYSYDAGIPYRISEIVEEMRKKYPLVKNICLTGGEPLLQPNAVELMKTLEIAGYKTSVETSGSISVKNMLGLRNTDFIVDMKMPTSKMELMNKVEDLSFLRTQDSVKFVCKTREDFDYAMKIIYSRKTNASLLFSPCWDMEDKADLVSWILNEDKLLQLYQKEPNKIRYSLQVHKVIWGVDEDGSKERTATQVEKSIPCATCPKKRTRGRKPKS